MADSPDDYGTLAKGTNINIRRSNGRVHKSIITTLGPPGLVTVEWYENGQTKGKEIELESVFELNPEYMNESEEQKPTRPTTRSEAKADSRRTLLPAPSRPTRVKRETRVPQPCSEAPTPTAAPPSVMEQNVNASKASAATEMPPPKAPTRPRRSTVVDQVEKISQKREERRAAQIKERELKKQFYDPNNPMWEFAIMVREYRENLEMQPLAPGDPVVDTRICVCVRKRPLNRKEISRKEIDVITIPSKDILLVSEPKTKVDLTKYLENQKFRFDYAFDETCSNQLVYRYTARPLVHCIFGGGMATCFAYGQTGSGKTHTMGGDFTTGKMQDASKGIYALAAQDVFHLLKSPSYQHHNFTVYCTFFEIYSGKVFDLLNKKARLRVLEDRNQQVQVVGLVERQVSNMDDILQLIQEASKCRTSGVTSANQHSSRSHAVFQIILREKKRLHGKFSLIDLAGNERGADTMSASRQTRIEGSEINKSLLALKECIRAMSKNQEHLPFRASTLTQVLRDSFIGERSRTCMIATVSPGINCCEHSLNSLRYADRVKELPANNVNDGQPQQIQRNGQLPDLKEIKEESGSFSTHHQNGLQPSPMSPNQSDLAILAASVPTNEISREMLEIHQTVSTLQEKEEEAVEGHRKFIAEIKQQVQAFERLLEQTEEVEFDGEQYHQQISDQMENACDVFTEEMTALSDKFTAYKNAMNEEEKFSKRLTGKGK
uniref:kinesin-like protein KIF2A n=1 Tax=Styela clava TaxID=7725 RepID=UPI001939F6E9|nr:kinesin-like protein KIF2A [Styela clava]